MNDLGQQLRDGDPVGREAGMSPADVNAMRRMILAAVPATREDVWSPGPLLLAATVAVALVIGAFAGTEFHPNETRVANPSPSRSGEHRQVQFETPGGTRVIWVLNSDLDF